MTSSRFLGSLLFCLTLVYSSCENSSTDKVDVIDANENFELPNPENEHTKLDTTVSKPTLKKSVSKQDFVHGLKNGEDLRSYFNLNWTLVYHVDNRCDGSTDGQVKKLSPKQIDQQITIIVKNDGDGWACEQKPSSTFDFQFSLKQLVKKWDRFETSTNLEEEAYIHGAGESDYLKLHYHENGLIKILEYRSEDPG